MKVSLLTGWTTALVLFLLPTQPAHADASRDMLNQAIDLVDQALNTGGPMPSNDERTDLVTKALDLAQNAPGTNFQGHRIKAVKALQAALDQLKQGDPNGTTTDFIRAAKEELRTAISIST